MYKPYKILNGVKQGCIVARTMFGIVFAASQKAFWHSWRRYIPAYTNRRQTIQTMVWKQIQKENSSTGDESIKNEQTGSGDEKDKKVCTIS